MQDKTITNALLALRAQIVRENLERLENVNALLLARGIDPDKQIVRRPRKTDCAKHGMMRRMISDALRGGPMPLHEIVSAVAAMRPEIDRAAAQKRCGLVLSKMKAKGMVVRDGKVWGLAGCLPNNV